MNVRPLSHFFTPVELMNEEFSIHACVIGSCDQVVTSKNSKCCKCEHHVCSTHGYICAGECQRQYCFGCSDEFLTMVCSNFNRYCPECSEDKTDAETTGDIPCSCDECAKSRQAMEFFTAPRPFTECFSRDCGVNAKMECSNCGNNACILHQFKCGVCFDVFCDDCSDSMMFDGVCDVKERVCDSCYSNHARKCPCMSCREAKICRHNGCKDNCLERLKPCGRCQDLVCPSHCNNPSSLCPICFDLVCMSCQVLSVDAIECSVCRSKFCGECVDGMGRKKCQDFECVLCLPPHKKPRFV